MTPYYSRSRPAGGTSYQSHSPSRKTVLHIGLAAWKASRKYIRPRNAYARRVPRIRNSRKARRPDGPARNDAQKSFGIPYLVSRNLYRNSDIYIGIPIYFRDLFEIATGIYCHGLLTIRQMPACCIRNYRAPSHAIRNRVLSLYTYKRTPPERGSFVLWCGPQRRLAMTPTSGGGCAEARRRPQPRPRRQPRRCQQSASTAWSRSSGRTWAPQARPPAPQEQAQRAPQA